MRMAVIDGSTVVNVIEAEPGFELPGFSLVATETAGPGWTFHHGINTFSPPQAPLPTLEDYQAAIDDHIEQTARERDYGSDRLSATLSIATYVTSSNPAWKAEAEAFIAWRDAVWVYAFGELAKVMNEEREQPSPEDLIAELPAIDWP